MLKISNLVWLSGKDIEFQAIRAQGPGGQNVNKVSSAIHIRFDIRASDLPDFYKEKLLALNDNRITKDGVVVIKAQTFRSQEKNREDGLNRLAQLIRTAVREPRKRRPSKPSRSSKQKRMDSKTRHGNLKILRKKVIH
ncbi:MAG: aminoacyl-tRNA hydrolase [Proteobacteria bacterium]|nr:aminoacyl-tRNA hydrolase [Desulfobacula sp.]MBU4132052.1 aminoacyl-tRNA hydrolase [Pseudomonadota bacterium]